MNGTFQIVRILSMAIIWKMEVCFMYWEIIRILIFSRSTRIGGLFTGWKNFELSDYNLWTGVADSEIYQIERGYVEDNKGNEIILSTCSAKANVRIIIKAYLKEKTSWRYQKQDIKKADWKRRILGVFNWNWYKKIWFSRNITWRISGVFWISRH